MRLGSDMETRLKLTGFYLKGETRHTCVQEEEVRDVFLSSRLTKLIRELDFLVDEPQETE